MSAIAMTYGDASQEDIISVAESFSGLPHRCMHIGSYGGVDYYDSSIDSSPARTAETLSSLGRRVVIILGGRSKGVSYSHLVPNLKEFAHAVIITGECADEIYRDVKGCARIIMVDNFDDAVLFAAELGKECGAVLLSPASTSYDAFKNYEERGNYFRKCIEKMH
jgi:UDP-N-acetylmuramoylalanine--D-glutamate ligase